MLVGREDVLGEARDRLDMALSGSGSTLLLVGEPGVGKTRLAQEIVRVAVEAGFASLWGACWDTSDSPPYWPWAQLLRSYAASSDQGRLAAAIGHDGPLLARIAPEFGDLATDVPDAEPSSDQRWRMLDSVASFFITITRDRPLCLVIDDIHSADPSSIELLSFLNSRIAGAPILMVATRRSNEPRPGPVSDALDEVTAVADAMEIHGLAPDDVVALFEAVTGTTPSEELARAIHDRSGGNPLFVREHARLLVAQGHLADPHAHAPLVPASVEPVIARRIRLLSGACRSFLEAAAVLGTRFAAADAAEIGAAGNHPMAISEAEHAGLVVRPVQVAGLHRFAHGLVRDVVYSAIEPGRRADLHRSATGLDTIGQDELLHHYEQAGGHHDLLAALELYESVADRALDRLAFGEAADLARRGLQLAATIGVDDARSIRLRMTLGKALNRAGRADEARPVLAEVIGTARDRGDYDTFVDAVLQCWFQTQRESLSGMGTDAELCDLIEEALPHHPIASRRGVLLRWRLARELNYVQPERASEWADEALAGARQLGDPLALGRALEIQSQHTYYRTGTARDRLDAATEIRDLGHDHGLTDLEMSGHVWRTLSYLQLGDIAAVDREIAAAERLVERARLRVDGWFPPLWRAMRTLLDGEVEEAERLAGEALAAGDAFGMGAFDHYGMQLMAIRREQGRMDELIDAMGAGAAQYPDIPAYRGALAMAHAECGRLASAQAELDLLAPNDFGIVPRDYNIGVSLMVLSIACVLIGDEPRAEALLRRWEGLEDDFVTVGYGAVSGGSGHYFVGTLHHVLGATDEARHHLETALARNRAEGAVIWTTRTEIALADVLADGDPLRASTLAAQARVAIDELNLVSAGAALERVERRFAPSATSEGRDRATEPDGASTADAFRWDGDLWTIVFEGKGVHVRDAKGVRDIARLLTAPGQEIHALQLMTGGEPVTVPASADTVIDDEAAMAYRDRINELHDDIDDADAMADVARAEKARVELDRLTEELASAFGLGGKPRKAAGDPAERARKAVTARVRDSIRRIAAAHPALGTHLDRSVNTGTFLSYTPDRPIRWEVDV